MTLRTELVKALPVGLGIGLFGSVARVLDGRSIADAIVSGVVVSTFVPIIVGMRYVLWPSHRGHDPDPHR